jgi:hypothetical protein
MRISTVDALPPGYGGRIGTTGSPCRTCSIRSKGIRTHGLVPAVRSRLTTRNGVLYVARYYVRPDLYRFCPTDSAVLNGVHLTEPGSSSALPTRHCNYTQPIVGISTRYSHQPGFKAVHYRNGRTRQGWQ